MNRKKKKKNYLKLQLAVADMISTFCHSSIPTKMSCGRDRNEPHPKLFNFFFFFFLRRYNFREVLAFSTNSFHLGQFLMQSFQIVIFIFVISLFTSSSHLFLGLPSDLVNAGAHSYTFFYHAVVWHTMYVSKPS
jgi:hypothetical protein